jgi:transketolase
MEAWALLKKAGKSVGVLNMASLLPLDTAAIAEAAGIGPIVTAEDHHRDTGLGASVATVLIDKGLAPKMKRLGVKQYGGSGKPSDLYKQQGLDAESIAKTVLALIG